MSTYGFVGKTQTYLAVHTRLGRSFISDVENGKKEPCLHSLEILSMNGDTCSVPHRVGMTYIAELLLQPNQPINAITLLTPLSSAPDLDPRVHSKIAREDMPSYDDEDEDSAHTDCTSLGPDGEVLLHDYRSSAFLKKRALELKEAIEEKRKLGQDCGKELADLESITEYILAGTWHGKIKSFPNYTAEKARKNASKAIKGAIKKIRKVCPAIADHFEKNIKFGATLEYQATAAPWRVSLE